MTSPRAADAAIDAFLADGITELPDRAFDAVRGDIHRTRQRVVIGSWREPDILTPIRFALAAAIVVVALGFAWNEVAPRQPAGGVQGTPGPTPADSGIPEGSAAAAIPITGPAHELALGRYSIDYARVPGAAGGPLITFDIAATGWQNVEDFGIQRSLSPEDTSPGAGLEFWNITNLVVDPCTAHAPSSAPPGPGIAELLQALGGQPGIRPGPITDITLGGYHGSSIDLTVIAAIGTCPDGYIEWGDEGLARRADLAGEVDRIYALDVDGRRITFFTRALPDTPTVDMRQLDRILASIAFQG